ncbi:DUF4190 domain-containing protein [Alkalihalophilus pseudofirmus]|jgi:hypothetical protein|uniref:DUF4190 domain-containing protein n=2 Tax=Alkalihalophilus TaxID=2893060 RepID=A0AAJ2KUC5_ALKPS|nr:MULTISPECIES: DUF4190 domain-containing protein [Alkalihalophilus]ERN54794.1 hypothetical protein A33I_05440 [Alkalihalophilus marmarensis DSM 21297]MCM3488586.1 DUF4190 domain-containing protein [Alkalihalophilus marmarensis]MDV2884018.1 DUF4190 domain-containing protein [Alkalihalophilus pseudofirmus]MED1602433.1 DUF4190 domain-containing protein [Alkalihalophilus marmarensis]WEG18043.1 DUF4190 domain-containing protein [Alkalihalophilus pseudofirmus]
MADDKHPKDEPIRLLDEDDRSLTLVNNHVEGRDDDRDLSLALSEEEREAENHAEVEEEPVNSEYPLQPSFQEESAAEYAAVNGMAGARPFDEDQTVESAERRDTAYSNEDDVTAGRGVGTFAIVLSILSLFFLPVLLGAAGIVIGFVSRRIGSTSLGNWAIGIGAVSILMTVFFSPFF